MFIFYCHTSHTKLGLKVKPSNLDGLKLTLTDEPRSSIVGTLSRKRTDYDVWSIQNGQNVDEDETKRPIGGEEVLDLSCLLPRSKKGGKLFLGKSSSSEQTSMI